MVGPEDQLWILDDFAFSTKAMDRAYVEQILNQLPGAEHHLIIGNHDNRPTIELPWDSVSHLVEVRDGPQNQLNTLCHYPMITWNHARRGAMQFFGHVHDNRHGSWNSVNVGVDVWDFMPITFDNIVRRAKKLPPNKHWGDVEHGADGRQVIDQKFVSNNHPPWLMRRRQSRQGSTDRLLASPVSTCFQGANHPYEMQIGMVGRKIESRFHDQNECLLYTSLSSLTLRVDMRHHPQISGSDQTAIGRLPSRGVTRFQSNPSKSASNWDLFITIIPSVIRGHSNPLPSIRL